MSAKAREHMTIGQVTERLAEAYPGVSISKLRFLEDEGLISPERSPGGYRKYSASDLARIELVLKLQKEHFLPLAVIREKLKEYDHGRLPAELRDSAPVKAQPVALPLEEAEMVPLDDAPGSLGLPVSFIRELAEFGLVRIEGGEEAPEELSRADAAVAHACWDLRRFGVEPRHLRMYQTFVEREAALMSQILMPAFRHRTPETRQKLVDALGELTTLTEQLKRLLLHRAMTDTFEDVV